MKTYYSLLDLVRFFAAFWVMNFHYFFGLELSSSLSWYRYGNLGVQLFFIISGFVIVQSLHGKTIQDFAISRFIRLFPLFWILCTITYILTLIIPHAGTVHFGEYVISMTMLGDVYNGFFGSAGLVDPSYWTLTVELLFYTSISLFTYFFSYKNVRYFLLAWLACSVVAFSFHIDQYFYIKLLLVRHASYFIFGSALALIAMKQAQNLYERYFDFSLLFISAIYATSIHPYSLPAYTVANPFDAHIITILHILFFVTIPVFVYLSPFIKNRRIITGLTILGGLTYPLYLLHQKIGNVLINYVTNTYNIPWNTFAICFEIFIIAGAYVLYLQDKKLREWLKQKMLTQK